uniref:Uncharacterized protein n=1 Tax=Romanomermis culicivorax TaxID=13658 RepID=A0A915KHU1_ROMCU
MWSTFSGASLEYIDKQTLEAELSNAFRGGGRGRKSRKSLGGWLLIPPPGGRGVDADASAISDDDDDNGVNVCGGRRRKHGRRRRVSSASVYKCRSSGKPQLFSS